MKFDINEQNFLYNLLIFALSFYSWFELFSAYGWLYYFNFREQIPAID